MNPFDWIYTCMYVYIWVGMYYLVYVSKEVLQMYVCMYVCMNECMYAGTFSSFFEVFLSAVFNSYLLPFLPRWLSCWCILPWTNRRWHSLSRGRLAHESAGPSLSSHHRCCLGSPRRRSWYSHCGVVAECMYGRAVIAMELLGDRLCIATRTSWGCCNEKTQTILTCLPIHIHMHF